MIPKRCNICNGTSLNDLTHGHGEGVVVCETCGARWWKNIWRSATEWAVWIEEDIYPQAELV